jgi:hypothetical protein
MIKLITVYCSPGHGRAVVHRDDFVHWLPLRWQRLRQYNLFLLPHLFCAGHWSLTAMAHSPQTWLSTFFFFFCFFDGRFELRAWLLQSRHSAAWATPPVHFILFNLEMWLGELFAHGWPWITILLISGPNYLVHILSLQCGVEGI